MDHCNGPCLGAGQDMLPPTTFERDAGQPSRLDSLQRISSPYLTPFLEARTRKIESLIELDEVHLPPVRCLGTVTISRDAKPPPATTVPFEDGTDVYFTPVCVIDLETDVPICALYCLNIHRVFMRCEPGKMVDLSPTALEVLGGRGANRKWRVSLKVVEVEDDRVTIRMGLGKWLDLVGLDIWLPDEATSRVGSKQSSRNPTPLGSPYKRKRSTNGRDEANTRAAIDMDAMVDAFSRHARVISSGQVLWHLCVQGVQARHSSAPSGELADTAACSQKYIGRCHDVHRNQHDPDDTESDDALVYLPSSLMRSRSS